MIHGRSYTTIDITIFLSNYFRQYHALLAHPVNKPYHSNKRLVQQVRQMQKLEEAEIEDIKQSQFTAADTDTTAIQKVLIYCVLCVNLWLSV